MSTKKKADPRDSPSARGEPAHPSVDDFEQKRILKEFVRWIRKIDKDDADGALLVALSECKAISTVYRTLEEIRSAKRALASNNLTAAASHLDRAEALGDFDRANLVTFKRVIQEALKAVGSRRLSQTEARTAAETRRQERGLDVRNAEIIRVAAEEKSKKEHGYLKRTQNRLSKYPEEKFHVSIGQIKKIIGA